jgi:glucose/mannose-6-phosphate isomerase
MMQDAIRSFPSQFSWKPKIVNAGKLKKADEFVVLGMGGSNLAFDLLKIRDPKLKIHAHRDYGLPALAPKGALYIASSYSGNTEETIAGFLEAKKRGLPLAALATGGKLLALAKRYGVPYVEMPKTGIQPRSALGFAALSLAALMGLRGHVAELSALSKRLNAKRLEAKGKALARSMKGRVPVIYASLENAPIAYNWKIKFNETGKIPAFSNSFPELNHNEMTGFDSSAGTKKLSRGFHFVFLKDGKSAKVAKRMDVTARLYRARGLKVEVLPLSGRSAYETMFNSLLLADWTAYYTGKGYGAETNDVPMVEEFKRLIA